MENDNTIFSVTAHIDLLGFSSHLILSSYDLRTKIGEEAIERLRIIEEAVELIEKESAELKEYYPETFRVLRFNDSLILGIDINPPILPRIGQPHEGGSLSFEDAKKYFSKNKEEKVSEQLEDHFNSESYKVAQFVGLVSRIHNYINSREFDIHMPGCQTVISSGLRYRFFSKKDNKEDFYSANFSLANAYIANDLGSKYGFSGNKCFIENNVASICGLNVYVKRALGFGKFIREDMHNDPFIGKPNDMLQSRVKYVISKSFDIELFNKKYRFRELNTIVGSNLQLFPEIVKIKDTKFSEEKLFRDSYIKCFTSDCPDISIINDKDDSFLGNPHLLYPVLYFPISLKDKVSEVIKILNQ